jgi:hypothetical protein
MKIYLGYEVLKVVVTKSYAFWDIGPSNPMKVIEHCGGICRLLVQGRKIIKQACQLHSSFSL